MASKYPYGRPLRSVNSKTSYSMRVKTSSNEHDRIQKKTFLKWVNSQLSKVGKAPLKALLELSDGVGILDLLEILTGEKVTREKGTMKLHKINNVSKALEIMKKHQIRMVNIHAEDIVSGNVKILLGLVWTIIYHWQVKDVMAEVMESLQQTSFENTLLGWVRQSTRVYKNVNVVNFTSSWTDGRAFCALVHRYRPDLFEFDEMEQLPTDKMLGNVFQIAYDHLGVEMLLDAEDVNCKDPDKKSIMMYITSLFRVLPQQITLDDIEEVKNIGRETHPEYAESTASEDSTMHPSEIKDMYNEFESELSLVKNWLEKQDKILGNNMKNDVNKENIREQFQVHEDFMMGLASNQDKIGHVLTTGRNLIQTDKGDNGLSVKEKRTVSNGMESLNAKWEELKKKSMKRQAELQLTLVDFQKKQINSLESWLSEIEKQISEFDRKTLGGFDDVKKQLDEIQAIQEKIDDKTPEVQKLSKIVVIVENESDQDSMQNVEQKLQELSNRWSSVHQWAEEKRDSLYDTLLAWKSFNLLAGEFDDIVEDTDQIPIPPDSLTELGTKLEETKSQGNKLIDMYKKQQPESESEKLIEDALGKMEVRYRMFQSKALLQKSSNHTFEDLLQRFSQNAQDVKALLSKLEGIIDTPEMRKLDENANIETVEEIICTLDNATPDIELCKTKMEELDSIRKKISDLSKGQSEPLAALSDDMKEVESRWNDFDDRYTDFFADVKDIAHIVNFKGLQTELQAKVDRCVMHYDNTLQNSDQNSSEDLEQLNNSVDALLESQKFLKNFCEQNQTVRRFLNDPKESSKLDQLHQDCDKICEKVKNFIEDMERGDASPSVYAVALSRLNDWLTEAEQTLDAETIQISDENILKEQYSRYCELREALGAQQSNIDFVTSANEELSQGDQRSGSYNELLSVKKRWNAITKYVEDRIASLEQCMNFQNDFKRLHASLSSWLDKVDAASSGSLNGFQLELKNRREEYEKIVFFADELAGKSTDESKKKMKHHLELLKERWTSAEEKVKFVSLTTLD